MAAKKKTAKKKKTLIYPPERKLAKSKNGHKRKPALKSAAKKKNPCVKNATPKQTVERALRRADSFYNDFHWGRDAKEIIKTRIKATPKVLVSLGELHAVEYKAAKGNGRKVTYRHVFHKEKPILCSDSRGRDLYIIGGDYIITERGIEG